jgi:hypothetical protein
MPTGVDRGGNGIFATEDATKTRKKTVQRRKGRSTFNGFRWRVACCRGLLSRRALLWMLMGAGW